MLTALELMKPMPSRGPKRTGARPRAASASAAGTTRSPSQHSPSPPSATPISASTVRSPVPSEPSSRASGVTPARQRAQQAVEQRLPDARAARADLVRAHGHRRAHHLDAQRRAAAAGVAAHEPPLVVARVLELRRRRAQRADPGARAVEQLAAVEQVAHEPQRGEVALARLAR